MRFHDDGTAYVTLMEKRIMSVWQLPENSEGKKVVVFMKLDRAGRVSDVRVEKSSGDEAFDESALRAVRTAAPFPAVPEVIKHVVGDLWMVLDPTRPAPKNIPGQEI